jgi:signal transduction histidine kinase
MVSFAGYPLMVDGQLVGVAALFAQRVLSEFTLKALATAADSIALGIGRKLTERDLRLKEEQLRQAQRMEAIGQLAGGVAHDFNNLLAIITGYGDLLQRDIGPRHPAFRRVEEIRKAAERASGLTRQLLAFSRKQVLKPQALDLNAVVREIEEMLRRLIGEQVQLITNFAGDLGRVRADRGQMEQLVVNLALNAPDAMPMGGKLIVVTANVELDEPYIRSHPEAPSGPHVMLSVSDSGHGINAETLSHMFEPFFTTKKEGQGTGLGLATVDGIVRQNDGHLTVSSNPGRGATFKIYLPRIGDRVETVTAPMSAEAPPIVYETILLVEDEQAVRVLMGEILEAAGTRCWRRRRPRRRWPKRAAIPAPSSSWSPT